MKDGISDQAERMRFRDLILQAERFVKYAPKGTDSEVLRLEAREFNRRLGDFTVPFNSSKAAKLQRKLKEIEAGKSWVR